MEGISPVFRKTMLRKSKVEYADYVMNHVQGCSHGCRYPCYAYLMAKRFGTVSSYGEWIRPRVVANTLDLLRSEIPNLKDRIGSVHLSFTTDPFMCGHDDIRGLSIEAIRMLNDAGIPCTVLTKGVLPAELSDLDRVNPYGISLVSLDEGFRGRFEPGAAPFADRIAALHRLHDAGCPTWVSMEPYPAPDMVEQDLEEVLESVSFADRIVFGRLNYAKSSYPDVAGWYADRAREVMRFCDDRGIACHIKAGTLDR